MTPMDQNVFLIVSRLSVQHRAVLTEIIKSMEVPVRYISENSAHVVLERRHAGGDQQQRWLGLPSCCACQRTNTSPTSTAKASETGLKWSSIFDQCLWKLADMACSCTTCRALMFASRQLGQLWVVIAEDDVILTRYCVLELLLNHLWR
jgi:hypothetical protein